MPFNAVFSWLMKKRTHQIDLFRKYPYEVQKEKFDELIGMGQYTYWGKKYHYNSIESYSDYRERVPISTYEDLQPLIDRIYKGEQNLLWPTDIRWFAKSSGTTAGKSKMIPVSQEAVEDCHYKAGKDLLALYVKENLDTRVYTGKTFVVGGSGQLNENRSDGYSGDLSAILMNNLPLWVEARRIPNLSIALMDDWEEKIEKLAAATMNKNVSVISGVPSWMLIILKRIVELKGADNILDVWPNLELFMHGGVNFDPYRTQFEKLIPTFRMKYWETYNASEGFFGIQESNDARDLLLMLDYGIFYEFIPVSQIHEEQPKTLTIEDVKVGEQYALVISTNAGLWRYKIGDTIEFTSVNPYKIRVTGRTKHFINAFGEELIIDNAEKGLNIACSATGAIINEYTACPVYMDDNSGGGHEWLIEFEKDPHDFESFVDHLDKALMELNSDYEAKRSYADNLQRPIVRRMSKGTFYNWMKSRGKLGGQHKVPRLANDRKYVESILEMMVEHLA